MHQAGKPPNHWMLHVAQLHGLLAATSCRARGREIPIDEGFARWQRLTAALRNRRGTIYLIGNGASASMASHTAADLAKNAQLHTEVFSDLALITAVSNDLGYDQVFSHPLSVRSRAGDMLVAISSSGRSPNVLRAVKMAARRRLTLVTLSAMDRDNPLRGSGALSFYVGARSYGLAETCHAALLHHWMDLVEQRPRQARAGSADGDGK
ncbi:MAG: SIS domain-containing protein [Polyangia bacterium]|jgi:D-sedoheptulose 7-phosphate isomerase